MHRQRHDGVMGHWRHSPAATRGTRLAAGVLLLASLLAVAMRAPDGPRLTTTSEAPTVRPEADAGTVTSTVPPSRAPAPVPTTASTPQTRTAPPTEQVVAPDDTAAAAVDTLAVPDGSAGPAPTAASTAAAPPAAAPTTPVGPGQGDTPRARFASRFPAHEAATQDPSRPASTRWAVLVGVNEHSGATRDNVGSRQDAESLYAHLMDLGWRPDHVLLLTDGLATREGMVEGMRWLARKTTPASVAVFTYSGHAKQWHGQDVDGDGEVPDEGLWPSDNQHIVDSEFVELMAPVSAGRLWINIMACEAAGFLDPGLVRDGRVITYSSAEDEKSYEDPSVGHSVWGWNLVVQGLREGRADTNGDREVTVQEATSFAIPQAATRTARQAYGAQNGGMVDHSGGPFSLTIPEPPPEPASPEPSPSSSPDSCLLVFCSSRD